MDLAQWGGLGLEAGNWQLATAAAPPPPFLPTHHHTPTPTPTAHAHTYIHVHMQAPFSHLLLHQALHRQPRVGQRGQRVQQAGGRALQVKRNTAASIAAVDNLWGGGTCMHALACVVVCGGSE